MKFPRHSSVLTTQEVVIRPRCSNSDAVPLLSSFHGLLMLSTVTEENEFVAPMVQKEAQDSLKVL